MRYRSSFVIAMFTVLLLGSGSADAQYENETSGERARENAPGGIRDGRAPRVMREEDADDKRRAQRQDELDASVDGELGKEGTSSKRLERVAPLDRGQRRGRIVRY